MIINVFELYLDIRYTVPYTHTMKEDEDPVMSLGTFIGNGEGWIFDDW